MKKKRIYVLSVVVLIIVIIIGTSSVYVINQQRKALEETRLLAENKEEQVEKVENVDGKDTAKALPTIPDSWDQTKVTPVLSADNKYVPVPIGFTASKAEGEQEVDHGFVIYEGEVTAVDPNAWTEEEAWQASLNKNQFVWVPVEKPSERIYEASGEKNPKKARLWYFSSTTRTTTTQNNGASKREPGILKSNNQENLRNCKTYFNLQDYSRDTWYKELQVEFDTAMKSIEKYGGFFIGRYETGNISSSTPVVRRMNTNISNQTWYTMYNRMKNISSNPNIQTSMIWGCLWNETLQWLIDTGVKTYAEINSSTSWGNYYATTFIYKTNISGGIGTKKQNSSTRIPTGSTEYTKANNIYDLAGNVMECSLTADETGRSMYGGNYSFTDSFRYSVQYTWDNYLYRSYDHAGSRSYFYIK